VAARGKKKATKSKKPAGTSAGTNSIAVSKSLNPKAQAAVKKAAELLWGLGVPPHHLLQELHEVLLLRCLKDADGNYAAAATLFGPSRQSVQQYANSSLRDDRWKPYQQNRRRKRASA
jgi:hypothetical protein